MTAGFGITGGGSNVTGLNSQFGGFSYGPPSGWSKTDYANAVAAVAAEVAAKGNVLDMARIADVIANRESLGRYGATISEIINAPNQFSAATSKNPKDKPARDIFDAVYSAVKNGDFRAANRLGVADRINAAKAAIDGVKVTGNLAGIAKGATAYDNAKVTAARGTGGYHRGLESKNSSFTVGGHTFTGDRKDGFNARAPDIDTSAFSRGFGLNDWQGPIDALAAGRAAAVPDVSMGTFYDGQPNWSLADLAPDVTQAPAPDWSPFGDRTTPSARGPATDLYGFSTLDIGMPSAQISGLPGTGAAAAGGGPLSAQAAPGGASYGVTSFGPTQFSDAAAGTTFNSAGTYDPNNPLSAHTQPGAFDQPRTEFDRTGGLPSLAGLDPLESAREAFPGAGYDPLASGREAFPEPALAGLSPTGTGLGGISYSPSAVAASQPIGSPSTKGMSFGDMTRGIVGYDVKEVPNPAYDAWTSAWGNKPNSMQQAYVDDWADKIGNRSPFSPLASLAPAVQAPAAPARTTTISTPRYGDIPVGRPVGATLQAQPQTPTGMWSDQLTQQMVANNLAVNQFGQFGLTGFAGNFNTGFSPLAGLDGGGNASASAGGFGGVGGFGDARGGGYNESTGAPLGGSENQGGAGSGTGGLY